MKNCPTEVSYYWNSNGSFEFGLQTQTPNNASGLFINSGVLENGTYPVQASSKYAESNFSVVAICTLLQL